MLLLHPSPPQLAPGGGAGRCGLTAATPPDTHSPLSRGLREFTESRRPLPPRRGRACCSSFAVQRPFNPSPASPKSPRNPRTPVMRRDAPVRGYSGITEGDRRKKWGDLQEEEQGWRGRGRGERLLMVESPACSTCW